jgi:hypothetical protein
MTDEVVGEVLPYMCAGENLGLLEFVGSDRGRPIETVDEIGLPSLDGSIAEYQIILGNRYARARFVDFRSGRFEVLSIEGNMPFPPTDPRTSSTFQNLRRETSAGRYGEWRMTPTPRGARIEFVCVVEIRTLEGGLTPIVAECITKTDEFLRFLKG